MIKYLLKDLWSTIQYLPYVVLAGIMIGMVALLVQSARKQRGLETEALMIKILFFTYLAVLLIITFLSRESNGDLRIDLQIGSSLGINSRNDAYVIENILLFIPYGFLWTMLRNRSKGFISSFIIGLLTSWAIECLQLVSGRGIFQIDDMITNTLGCVIGFVIYQCFRRMFRK